MFCVRYLSFSVLVQITGSQFETKCVHLDSNLDNHVSLSSANKHITCYTITVMWYRAVKTVSTTDCHSVQRLLGSTSEVKGSRVPVSV